MTATALKEEFDYYLAHQDEIVREYDGQVVAIKDNRVLGAYPNELAALLETEKAHQQGTFLLQRVSPGPEAYTATFHSRVVFS